MLNPPIIIIIILSLLSSLPSPSSSFNLTQFLTDDPSHFYKVASSECHSLGIDTEIDTHSPVTLFVPDDAAFANAAGAGYKALPVANKYFIWQCHMISGYFTTSFLSHNAKVWHSQSTVGTEIMGDNKFMLNITVSPNGSVEVSNTVVRAIVTRTIFNENPIAIYGISEVLLPRDLPQIPSNVSVPVAAAATTTSFDCCHVRLGIGLCRYKLGQFEKARQAFERVLQLDPENVETLVGLAL
ncbi:fasciclin-like arabinogalactan protein 4 [Trifolium pratense]|uniref:fasciclin-like arabinogalactan protein 4 n=1 Tax=Trifolium pratense TaxID=57577 RepID=UPI001E692A57|nr:fasciclin-like arabinogalactan protein 4 [Trifolium pratense]